MKKVLLIKPPSDFNHGPQDVETLFESLKKVMRGIPFSLEINSYHRKVFFTARIDEQYYEILEGQIYSIWPDFDIQPIDEFVPENAEHMAWTQLRFEHSDLFPTKIYSDFQALPLSNVFSLLNKLGPREGVFYQVKILPFDYTQFSSRFKRNLSLSIRKVSNKLRIFKKMFDYKFKGENLEEGYKAAAEKNENTLHMVEITIMCTASNTRVAQAKLENICKSFLHFENNFNKPVYSVQSCTAKHRKDYVELIGKPQHFLSSTEVATYFHIPRETDQVPNIVKVLSKKAEPPLDLPVLTQQNTQEIAAFARTNFRDIREPFGISYKDRERHMYIIGKSGSGKSKLLEQLIHSDIMNDKGVCVMDPHGDLIDNVLARIPKERVKDVVLFDPGDLNFPISFNPLEKVAPEYRIRVASGFIEIFKKLFGANWTPRLEHVLRFVVLALLDTENATTMDILKLLTDRNFRQSVIPKIQDTVVKNFWTNEFAAWSEKFDTEAIMPILNKIGQFLSNTQVRNIVCQKKNKFDMKYFMDEGKIVLIKVSKGLLGEENSELIGSMIITKIQQAAMMRASIPEHQRRPFYFYVDEFQNFATDTFENILSEARKYKLSITVSHQFAGQLTGKMRATVFGNVGTIISFRIGPEDAPVLAKEFAPVFNERDIVNLGVQEIYLKQSINGEVKDAFSARTLQVPPPPAEHYIEQIKEHSRKAYATAKSDVEKEMSGKEDDALQLINQLQDAEFEAPML